MSKFSSYKPIAKNRRANFDYNIESTIIAGLVLTGPETKSCRNGSVSLKGAFANFVAGELWLSGLHISKYPNAVYEPTYDPDRPRKLLLNKSELQRIMASKQNGKHIVVISLGILGKYIKAELGIGQSKKLHDKRQKIKSRTQIREAQRAHIRATKA